MKAGGNKVDYVGKTQKVFDGIVKNLKFLGADGQVLTAGKSGKVPPGQVNGSGNVTEAFRYFYHPDHLGSTSYVTDASGEVYQHLEYFAFGETFVEEHSNTDRTPYLFNGKELDEETGLYYYGARYYDARTSVWVSVDPLAEKYPGQSSFSYAGNNPVIFVDVDGRDYGVYVNHQDRTITFRSHQISKSGDLASMNRAVSAWNRQSGNYVYVVGKGRSAVAYGIRFNVTTETDDRAPVQNRFATPFYSKGDERTFNDATGEVNSYNVVPDKSPRFNGYEDRTAGVNDGDKSFVKESHRNDNTGAHEVGHGLGNSHVNSGLMKDEGASGGIGSNHIEEMLARAGIGDPSKIGGTAGNATLHIQGQGPVNFNSGRVMTQRRFDRWQTRLANREVRKQERATRRSQND